MGSGWSWSTFFLRMGGWKVLQNITVLLLGLDAAWTVSDVSLSLEEKRVEITVTHDGGRVVFPECEELCTIADHATQRTGRHLDTMQFE